MGFWFWLAPIVAEVEAGSEGFGLNFNILETNLVNLAVVVGLVVYFGRSSLGKTLSERRSKIEAELSEVEARVREASVALEKQQKLVAEAKQEAERLLVEARQNAQKARDSIMAKAAEDVARMRATAAQDLTAEQERVIAELRQQAVELALRQAEQQLPQLLNADVQHRLIDRSLAMIGG